MASSFDSSEAPSQESHGLIKNGNSKKNAKQNPDLEFLMNSSNQNSSYIAEAITKKESVNDSDYENFFNIGREEEKFKNYTDAIISYTKSIRLNQHFYEAYKRKFICLAKQNKIEEAISFIQNDIKQNFIDKKITPLIGLVYYIIKDKEKVLYYANKALEEDSENDDALLLKINYLLDNYLLINNKYNNNIEIENNNSDENNNNDNRRKIKEEINNLVTKLEDNFSEMYEYYMVLAKISENENNYDRAIEYLAICLEQDKSNIEALSLIASCYYNKEKYLEAYTFYKQISVYDPNVEIYYKMGMCNYNLELFQKAVQDFEMCLLLDSKYENALLFTGISYINLSEEKNAENYLIRLLEVNPQNMDGYINLIKLYIVQKKLDEAKKLNEKAKVNLENKKNNDKEKYENHFAKFTNIIDNYDGSKADKKCNCASCLIF